MKKIIHKASERGFADHGWLKAAHSFSFGSYYNPAKSHFGLLRVLNDDIIAGGMGFGTHGHDNMEIVTIPLQGALAHKDSLGSEGTIEYGEVQAMSAGSGIQHSEFNGLATGDTNILQIWVFPKERNITPRYDQKRFDPEKGKNQLQVLVSPETSDDSMWINQDAYFSLGDFDTGRELTYSIKKPGNGAYIFIIEGEVELDGEKLERRDAIGILDTESVALKVINEAKILVIEVPME
ncbi:MAG: pirin family protein [Pyrinomonadaceae bacterium]|nr:pirin family protein [Sphingobacteriaceae bacterium]